MSSREGNLPTTESKNVPKQHSITILDHRTGVSYPWTNVIFLSWDITGKSLQKISWKFCLEKSSQSFVFWLKKQWSNLLWISSLRGTFVNGNALKSSIRLRLPQNNFRWRTFHKSLKTIESVVNPSYKSLSTGCDRSQTLHELQLPPCIARTAPLFSWHCGLTISLQSGRVIPRVSLLLPCWHQLLLLSTFKCWVGAEAQITELMPLFLPSFNFGSAFKPRT